MKKIDLLLITAVSRTWCLKAMYRYVCKVLANDERFNVHWLFCIDYPKIGEKEREDISEMYRYISSQGIKFTGLDCGNGRREPHYGGDLFNEGLKCIMDYFGDSYNPWCYILDDDNIVSKNMLECVIDADKRGIFEGMWLDYQMDNGKIDNHRIGYDALVTIEKCKRHYNGANIYLNNPDPSTILLKLDVYRRNFPMNGGIDYDFTYCRRVITDIADEGKLYCQGNNRHNYWDCNIGAYHNAIVDGRWLSVDKALGKDKCEATVILTGVGVDQYQHRYVLNEDAYDEIIKLIEKYGLIGNE